jgi:hypothetical protein
MSAYRLLWLVVCAVLAFVGGSVAVVLFPAALVCVLVAFGLVGSILALCLISEYGKSPPPHRLRLVVKGALVGGTTAGAFIGFAVLLGAGAFLLAISVLASSPYAVRTYGRWLGSTPTPTASQLDALAHAFAYASPEYVAMPQTPGLPDLTDEQLCQGWRASYMALQQQLSPSQTVATVAQRQGYLDEFDRRNPRGFAAWLAAGARAPGNPLPYLVRARVDSPTINWDELTRGQDW